MSITNVSTTVSQQVSTPSRFDRVSNHAVAGGLIGAAIGAGLSFTALPFVGALTAPIAAAIGGAAGIVVGSIVGLMRTRPASLEQVVAGSGSLPRTPPVPPTGTLPPPLPR